MKKHRIAKILMAVCLVFGMIVMPVSQLKVQAAEVIATVEGTVLSGTTSEVLCLSTKEGDMQIKLDSETDTSACKVLLSEQKVKVSVSHGSDGYLHAVKITSDTQTPSVTVDSSTTATVTGKIDGKSKGDIIFLETEQGEMEIKLDATTNMSGCSVLIADRSYTITCARGSDAYMHAVSIVDGASASTSSSNTATSSAANSGLTPAPADSANRTAATGTVSGKVTDSTKENLLYLSTKEGEMQFVIESNTDTRNGMVLTPDNKLTVSFYHGSDGYLHAVDIVGSKDDSSSADIDTSSPATVKGKVGSKSSENILFLDTDQGMMELKLDGVRSVSNCKVFVTGKKLTLTCARGSDAYMHALDITAE